MARPKDEDLGDDFSYILRMADTDMDGLKTLSTALTSVKGVGPRTAIQICKNTGFSPSSLAGHLSTEEQETLRIAIEGYAETVPLWMLNRQRDLETGDELHLTGQQVTLTLKDDIDLSRGDMLVRANNQPESTQALDARLCWLSEAPLNPATRYVLRHTCLLYTSPSPRDVEESRMPSSA